MGRAQGGRSSGEAHSSGSGSSALTESNQGVRAPVPPINHEFVKCPVCADRCLVLANSSEDVTGASLPRAVGLKEKGTLARCFRLVGDTEKPVHDTQAWSLEARRGRCWEAP